jgi:hypothetical protein
MDGINGKINVAMVDDFTVLDLSENRKSGITLTEFTKELYNPSGTEVSGSITITITELGNGNYRASFTPNAIGIWKLNIFHPTYFPKGQEGTYKIYTEDVDSSTLVTQKFSFNDAVYLNTTGAGTAGTTYPTGTFYQPSDNLADTLTIAALYNIKTIKLRGNITLSSSISGYNLEGIGAKEINIITLASQNVLSTQFKNVTLGGASNGGSFYANDIIIRNVSELDCVGGNIIFSGTNTMAEDGNLYVTESYTEDYNPIYFDMNTNSKIVLNNFYGKVNFQNLTNNLGRIMVTGEFFVSLLGTITAGLGYFYGIGYVNNIETLSYFQNYTVPQSIFEAANENYITPDTFGALFNDMSTKIIAIPSNPMLDDSTGSTFTAIPNMAKEATLTDIKGSGFVPNTDSLVNLSHTDIEVTAQIIRNAMALNVTSGTVINSESIDAKLNAIPTNPLLDSTTGSTFTSIPDMGKSSEILTLSGVINSGFSSGAKETTLTDIKGSGFVPNTDSLVNLSHTDIEVTAQIIRDAMKLSPSSGTIPIDSIDGKIDALVSTAIMPVANFDPY